MIRVPSPGTGSGNHGSDGTDDATGTRVHARHVDHAGAVNTVALTRAALDAAHPLRRARWDRDWQRLEVSAERGSLTVRAAGRTGARWDRLVTQELDEVVDAYLADPHLRVLVLRGGADFCAGLDLDEVGWGHTRVAGRHGFVGLTARDDLDKPVVAAVTGAAHDEGLEVLLACHVVLAADDADLALTQPSRGLLAEHGGPERLLRALGPATAYDLALTGRHVDAHEALRLGLVSRVAPGADLDDVLAEVVSQVLAQSPTSLRATLLAARGDATGIDEVTFSEDLLRATTARQQGTDPEWSGV